MNIFVRQIMDKQGRHQQKIGEFFSCGPEFFCQKSPPFYEKSNKDKRKDRRESNKNRLHVLASIFLSVIR